MDLPAYLSIHRLFLSLLADVFRVSEAFGIADYNYPPYITRNMPLYSLENILAKKKEGITFVLG